MKIIKHHFHGKIYCIDSELAAEALLSQKRGRLSPLLVSLVAEWQKIKKKGNQ